MAVAPIQNTQQGYKNVYIEFEPESMPSGIADRGIAIAKRGC